MIKERLTKELLPGELRVFLDLDDMVEGRGAEAIEECLHVLLFFTEGYFESQNCFRELLYAHALGKPMVIMIESENVKHGGITFDEAMRRLPAACAKARGQWGLAEDMRKVCAQPSLAVDILPSCATLAEALQQCRVVTYDRVPAFLDVSLRILCEPLVQPPLQTEDNGPLSAFRFGKRGPSTSHRWSGSSPRGSRFSRMSLTRCSSSQDGIKLEEGRRTSTPSLSVNVPEDTADSAPAPAP